METILNQVNEIKKSVSKIKNNINNKTNTPNKMNKSNTKSDTSNPILDSFDNPNIEHLHNLLNKSSYLDKYGNSVLLTIFMIGIILISLLFINLKENSQKIKNNWNNERCKPHILPFAGFINKPENKTALEFTAENFENCTNIILKTIVSVFTAPLHAMSNSTTQSFLNLNAASNMTFSMIDKLNTKIMKVLKELYEKIKRIVPEMQKIFINISDIFEKSNGIMRVVVYILASVNISIKAALGAFIAWVVKWMWISVAIIILMLIIPFTHPIAAMLLIPYLIVLVLVNIVIGNLNHILYLSNVKRPGKPGCFHENTLMQTARGKIPIRDIKVGDVLENNNVVTSHFILDGDYQELYLLDNIIVSQSHMVFHRKKGWIPVGIHDEAVCLNNTASTIYCINTSNKVFKINNTYFLDWDETDWGDIAFLKHKSLIENHKDIHTKLDAALHPNTIIQLENGETKKISEVKLNDVLVNNNTVLGVVKIYMDDIKELTTYNLDDDKSIIGVNLKETYENLGILSNKTTINNNYKLTFYHLLTDSGILNINGVEIYDYNSGIEHLIDY